MTMDRFDELKNHSFFVPHKVILNYCPYYFEIKEYLKGIQLPTKEEIIQFVSEHFHESEMYQKLSVNERLVKGKCAEEYIKLQIVQNADFRYDQLIPLVSEAIERATRLCDLIEYIAYYPSTYPVPKESEKNPDLEKLMDEYDMIVRYHMGDSEDMLISSDDIVRLIQTLDINLMTIQEIFLQITSKEIFMRRKSDDDIYANKILNLKNSLEMPMSSAQKEGYSRRKEGFEYLKRQHGDLSQYQ